MPLVVVAPDKFRGTADAAGVAGAMARVARECQWDVSAVPMSDGGEGLLDAMAGICPELVLTEVVGPDGRSVEAAWRCGTALAVIESAQASGLAVAGGAAANDPVAATSYGTGQLVVAAAGRIGPGGTVLVGLGGSATTDGGLGAIEAIGDVVARSGVRLLAACDVRTTFVDAARRFAPQKGADAAQVEALETRLAELAARYAERYGIDVRHLVGSGSAGGLGGAVAALGGELHSGYALVSGLVGLPRLLDEASLVLTGEGALDASSFAGKVVGGVAEDARRRGLPVSVVAGRCTDEGEALARSAGCAVVSLTREFGPELARTDPLTCVGRATRALLTSNGHGG